MRRGALLWRLLFVLAAVLFLACSDSDGDSVDAAFIQETYDQLGAMLDRASAGDVEGAEDAYTELLPAINLINRSLQGRPDAVIVRAELIDSSNVIRIELAENRRADVLAAYAENARAVLQRAAKELELDPPR